MLDRLKQLDAITDFWASSLGCHPKSLVLPGLTVCRGNARSDHEEVLVFRRDQAYVVLVEEKTETRATYTSVLDALRDIALDAVLDRAFWNQSLGPRSATIVGPAYVGYLYDGEFVPHQGASARALTDQDLEALQRFAARCLAIEWKHSGIEFDRQPIFGFLAEGEIVSAASFKIWGGVIAHIGVISDPSQRGKGFGKATVSAACVEAMGRGLIPQYQTLKSNAPSLEIARALGFQEYGTRLSIKLG
jgi:RimJ/RimL family protein N-acetyltransferase